MSLLQTRLGDILPWDEIADESERLLESDQTTRRAPDDNQADKEQEGDQDVDRDETARTWKPSSDGEDRTLLRSSGAVKFCTC
jgi:hypothetical protein